MRLHEILAKRFDAEELRTLCFDLELDYDDLKGEGKPGKVRELIAFLERRGRIAELVVTGKRLRPDAAWDADDAALPPPTASLRPERLQASQPTSSSPLLETQPVSTLKWRILYTVVAVIAVVAIAGSMALIFSQQPPTNVNSTPPSTSASITTMPSAELSILETSTVVASRVPYVTTAPTPQPPPTDTASPSSKTYSILVDERHGFNITDQLAYSSAEFSLYDSSQGEFTESNLMQYEALIIDFVGYGDGFMDDKCEYRRSSGTNEFTPKEITEITKYIRDGGSVLLVGLGWVWSANDYVKDSNGKCSRRGGVTSPIDNYPLNKIAQPAGIFFNNDYYEYYTGSSPTPTSISFTSLQLAKHSITQDVSKIDVLSDIGFGTLKLLNTQAVPILTGDFITNDGKDIHNHPVLIAAASFGQGRIICIQHPAFISKNIGGEEDDKSKLLANMLTWLVKSQ